MVRFILGLLSVGASLALLSLAVLGVGLMGDGTSKLLLNALILFCIVYAAVAGYLGYRAAMRSWAWWALWAAAALVIVPFALIQGLIYLLD